MLLSVKSLPYRERPLQVPLRVLVLPDSIEKHGKVIKSRRRVMMRNSVDLLANSQRSFEKRSRISVVAPAKVDPSKSTEDCGRPRMVRPEVVFGNAKALMSIGQLGGFDLLGDGLWCALSQKNLE